MATNNTLIDSLGRTGELQYGRRETFSGTVAANVGEFLLAERKTPGGIGTGNYFASVVIDPVIEHIEVRAVTAQTTVSFDAPGTMRIVYPMGALANGPTGGGGSSSGTGPYPVIVNVTDGAIPLYQARVTLTPVAGGLVLYSDTDLSGNVTLGASATAYTVAVRYGSNVFTPVSQTVNSSGNFVSSGVSTFIAVMTPTTLPPPSSAEVQGYLDVYDSSDALSINQSVRFQFTLVSTDATPGNSFPANTATSRILTTPATGRLLINLRKSATYLVRRELVPGSGQWSLATSVVTPATGPFPIAEILGKGPL